MDVLNGVARLGELMETVVILQAQFNDTEREKEYVYECNNVPKNYVLQMEMW